MKVRECMKLVENEKSITMRVYHLEFFEKDTQDGLRMQVYRSKDVAWCVDDLTEEILDTDIAKFRLIVSHDVYPTAIDIMLPWEDGMIPDYESVDYFEKESVEDEEIA